MLKIVLVLIVSISILGCATSYQKNGFSGGYSETQLGENVFRISFRGNGYTNNERAEDFTLLRSAELALEHGFKYFSIIDSASYTENSIVTTPTTSYTTANAYANGHHAYGSATTTTYGGQTYNISKPTTANTIFCYKDKPESGFFYESEFLVESISKKYLLNRNTDQVDHEESKQEISKSGGQRKCLPSESLCLWKPQ